MQEILNNLLIHPDTMSLGWMVLIAKINIFWKSFLIIGFVTIIMLLTKKLYNESMRVRLDKRLCVIVVILILLCAASIIGNIAMISFGLKVTAMLCNFELITNVVYTMLFVYAGFIYTKKSNI